MTCTGACNFGDGCNCGNTRPVVTLTTSDYQSWFDKYCKVRAESVPLQQPKRRFYDYPKFRHSGVDDVRFFGMPVVVDPTLPKSTIVMRNDKGDEVRVENLGETT